MSARIQYRLFQDSSEVSAGRVCVVCYFQGILAWFSHNGARAIPLLCLISARIASCACPESLGDNATPTSRPSTPMVIVERKCATVGPGKTLPVLLKFCALRASSKVLTVSYVRWTVLGTSSSSLSSPSPALSSSPADHPRGQAAAVHGGDLGARQASSPRVWIRHRLEGKGQLLHGTLEQRAAR